MNKIFRTLLMTIALVMGVVNVQAQDTYPLTFKVDGTIISEKQVAVGTTIDMPSVDVPTGHVIEWGWSPGTMPNYPVTIEGSIKKAKYNLIYMVDGSEYSSEQVEYGATIQAKQSKYWEHHTFVRWDNLPETMPANDVTVTGVYEITKYTITYTLDGETYSEVPTEYGSTIVTITPEIPQGKIFKGWNNVPETMPGYDIKITGNTVDIYTLTLSYNETQGTVTASKTTEIEKGNQITVTVNPLEGFEIASVEFRNADGSTPNNWGNYTVQFDESDVTCTVTFRQTGLVTYNVGNGIITGGNVTATPSTAAAGEEITLTLAPQSGYVLETISVTDGTNNIELSEDYKFTMPASNVTVNATFVDPASLLPKHTLTINIDGVQTTKEVAEETDLSIVLPTPTKNGYSFAGWTGMPEDGKMPTSDLELTAQFTEATYTLTFMLDNVVFGTPQQKKYGEAITTPTGIPVEDGYTFGGWQNVPATMPAQDLVIYGFHVKDSETVTLSVGSSGYSTYYGDKALYFNGTEAVKAYVAYAIGTSVVSLKQVIGSVAANTAMVLKGDAANASATIAVVGTGETKTNNLLRGVTVDTSINDFRKYVLVEKNAEDGTKVVKFADTGNRAATVPANKAYLQAPEGAEARQLTVVFENDLTNAIEIISVESEANSAVFNLSGQQVKNPGKGLYIINGKKVIIK